MKVIECINGSRGHYSNLNHLASEKTNRVNNACYPFTHITDGNLLLNLMHNKPEMKVIIGIRDLRDVVISSTHFFRRKISNSTEVDATFDEKLLSVINFTGLSDFYGPTTIALQASNVIKESNPFIIRFEDLIGEKGGGDRQKQIETIYKLAQYIEEEISYEQAEKIGDNLFGSSSTFRKGQIDQWKSIFNQDHIEAFKNSPMNPLLVEWGYENTPDWE
ncbi:sulfotransferase domain-containing protein [Chlamydiales bacterium]|nr:sulfotransferase domain-containing protein [Chlamydiales bacterium]